MIAWLVGKCHVGESYLDVLRFVISKLKGGKATYRGLPRKDRRALVKAVFKAHCENRELYGYVMKGGHGYTGKSHKSVRRANGAS